MEFLGLRVGCWMVSRMVDSDFLDLLGDVGDGGVVERGLVDFGRGGSGSGRRGVASGGEPEGYEEEDENYGCSDADSEDDPQS